jgi:hypothetical protein
MSLFTKKPPRIWGRKADGSQYIVGLTVAQLREKLSRFKDTDEVCLSVRNKKQHGFIGKLKSVENGSEGQIWLSGGVIDESLE